MSDIYTLAAKIQALPKRRIAEVEDFVDFLTLRRSSRDAKPPPDLEEIMEATEVANRDAEQATRRAAPCGGVAARRPRVDRIARSTESRE